MLISDILTDFYLHAFVIILLFIYFYILYSLYIKILYTKILYIENYENDLESIKSKIVKAKYELEKLQNLIKTIKDKVK
jgi:F0F1-type ATP synthase membrane subunit b/b'